MNIFYYFFFLLQVPKIKEEIFSKCKVVTVRSSLDVKRLVAVFQNPTRIAVQWCQMFLIKAWNRHSSSRGRHRTADFCVLLRSEC